MTGRGPRAFHELTPRGRAGRLRSLALAVLEEYDLDVRRCAFAAEAFNTVFRVDTVDGRSCALRMSPDLRIHADGCEEAEAAWVTALRHDVGFPAPAVIRARDGSAVVTAELAGVPGARTCVLFEWVYGGRLRDAMTAELLRRTGELMAITHEHGAGYLRDAPTGALVADRVCYFRSPNRLDDLRPTYGSTLEAAVTRSQATLDRMWNSPPHPPHLLHGDVQSGNVMVTRASEVVLIDFQDLIWGFEVQDVVIAIVALEGQGFGALTEAFRAGYEGVRPWPDTDAATISALRAARHLNILNFGLSMGRPGVEAFVARHAAPVVEWMKTG